jgi:hydrogenase nickel incorporation protein HypA/HybF
VLVKQQPGEDPIHEAGIAQNVVRIVAEAARTNGLVRVHKVTLEIGQFSGVEIGALEFAFRALQRGTVLEAAEIEYVTQPLVLYCTQCENEYLGDLDDLRCPACMQSCFEVVQGRELMVKSIAGTSDGAATAAGE